MSTNKIFSEFAVERTYFFFQLSECSVAIPPAFQAIRHNNPFSPVFSQHETNIKHVFGALWKRDIVLQLMNVIKTKAHRVLLKYYVLGWTCNVHWNSSLNSHGACLECNCEVAGNNCKDRAVTWQWEGRGEIDVLVYPWLTLALDGGAWLKRRPFSPHGVCFRWNWVGPRPGLCGMEKRKSLPPSDFEPGTAQPVTIRNTKLYRQLIDGKGCSVFSFWQYPL